VLLQLVLGQSLHWRIRYLPLNLNADPSGTSGEATFAPAFCIADATETKVRKGLD
jgi:hypothetical protein